MLVDFGEIGVLERVSPLAMRLVDVMLAMDARGLAATQVGWMERVIALRTPEGPTVHINPEFVGVVICTERHKEACLSFPGVDAVLECPAGVVLSSYDIAGDRRSFRLTGDMAQAAYHELAHLDGVLMIDRMSSMVRKMFLKRYAKVNQ